MVAENFATLEKVFDFAIDAQGVQYLLAIL